jgi:hypothetical protein
MKTARLASSALTLSFAAGLLAGCSGSGNAPVSGVPPAGLLAGKALSWMAPDAKRRDLLYVSDLDTDDVDVYSYPNGKLEGQLTGFQAVHYECVDAAGNVFIANGDAKTVVEYAHGGTTPIKTYTEPGFTHGCAIDPTTGDLAILHDPPSSGYGGFGIYKHAKGKATEYVTPNVFRVYFIGYDAKGDLFIDGTAYHPNFEIAELPAGSKTTEAITLNQSINLPGAIAWDGKYLAVGDQVSISGPSKIYQFTISGTSGTLEGTTSLADSCDVLQFWLRGGRVITSDVCAPHVLYFHYPAGGSSTKTISDSLHEPVGITVSPAK